MNAKDWAEYLRGEFSPVSERDRHELAALLGAQQGKTEWLAVRLRAALRDLASQTENLNFYDSVTGDAYPLDATLAQLDAEFPEKGGV